MQNSAYFQHWPPPSLEARGFNDACAWQRWETAALGDGNMRNLRKGDIIQLERKGYFIVDRPLISASKPLVRPRSGLTTIPDPLEGCLRDAFTVQA